MNFLNRYQLSFKALGLLRIFTGCILVLLLFERLNFSADFYSSAGILPLEHANLFWKNTSLSLFSISDSAFFASTLIVIQLAIALLFLLGFRTFWTSLLSTVLFISLMNRNQLVLFGLDDYLLWLLLWLTLLPCNRFAAIDSLWKNKGGTNGIQGIVPFAFQMQIAFVYVFAGFPKLFGDSWVTGSALYDALRITQLTKPFGTMLLQHPSLLEVLTYGTLLIEIGIGSLLLFPFRATRLVALPILCCLHLGIFKSFFLGFFPWLCIAPLLTLLPLVEERISPRPYSVTHSFFALMLMGVALLTNAVQTFIPESSIRRILFQELSYVNMFQRWDFFAPDPYKSHGWIAAVLTDASGEQINLVNPTQNPSSIPTDFEDYYGNLSWLTYYMNVQNFYSQYQFQGPLEKYFCKKVDFFPNIKKESIHLVVYSLHTYINQSGEKIGPEKIRLFETNCQNP